MDRFPPRLWLIEYPSGVRNFWYREPDGVERLNVTTIGQMISLQEHEALLQEERARAAQLLEALKKAKADIDGELCSPWVLVGLSGIERNLEPHEVRESAHRIAVDLAIAIAAHEKSQAGGG